MVKITDDGVFEAIIDADKVKIGDKYKYKIKNGSRELYRADPYGRKMEAPPYAASVLCDEKPYSWSDAVWISDKAFLGREGILKSPINIYELHAFSWKKHSDGSLYSFSELADELAPYVKQMGYTHVELMPVAEHPYGGSWGYQVCGYFSPTLRGGGEFELKRFVDKMHSAGIGVIFDWVPAHFPKDEFGLYEFDGDALYEYSDEMRRENKGWGTRYFDLSRPEVRSFLLSSASFWVDEYHADGLRVDAVSSMIYLDYEKNDGEWTPNTYGDNRCLEGIEFLKLFNAKMKAEHPTLLTVAEESSAWRSVTGNDENSLGFDLKWNMGWMNDTLSYAVTDHNERSERHKSLTFPMMYAFDEQFILPISHDEVVYGKKSFLDKMPGDYWQKFAGARLFAAYQMTFPGKKLNFMGNEIGQFKEWNPDGEIEWFLLDFDMHARYQYYISELNHLYLQNACLWSNDNLPSAFYCLDPDDSDRSIISFFRQTAAGESLTIALNFTPCAYEDYTLTVKDGGVYEEIFNSDSIEFGGSGVTNKGAVFRSERAFCDSSEKHVLHLRLPPLGVSVLRRINNC